MTTGMYKFFILFCSFASLGCVFGQIILGWGLWPKSWTFIVVFLLLQFFFKCLAQEFSSRYDAFKSQ